MTKSKDFVFKEIDNKLVFVGDFEGFYQATSDPWDQSAQSTMSDYYNASRERLCALLKSLNSVDSVIEVGCGLGYVTNFLSGKLPDTTVNGCDISSTAIKRAKTSFPHLRFTQIDISAPDFKEKNDPAQYDVVVLNQLLWYILEDLNRVMENVGHLLTPQGFLIVSNAFAREQRYGREIIDHFDGAAKFFRGLSTFELLQANYYNENFEHDDGHFLLQIKR